MKNDTLQKRRTVIPRWRSFAVTARLGDLKAQQEIEPVDPNRFEVERPMVAAFREQPEIHCAIQVLAGGLLVGNAGLASEAMQFLQLQDKAHLPSSIAELCNDSDGGIVRAKPSDNFLKRFRPEIHGIAALRSSLAIHPSNPVGWADLALAHAGQGRLEKAERCMCVAVGLAPDNRFVLRSAVRCFAHTGDIGRALRWIKGEARTRLDPWLMAAQISATEIAGSPQDHVRIAKRMIDSKSFSPGHLAELAAALGTLEMKAGAQPRANKLFRTSLVKPTENSLSQVLWAQGTAQFVEASDELNPPRSFEANARRSVAKQDWDEAIKATMLWLNDEPFSSRPAALGSFLSAVVVEDNRKAVEFTAAALKANREDVLLLNNHVFALARLGRLDEAESFLALACKNAGNELRALLAATAGLLEFRRGRLEEGRRLYSASVAEFERHDRKQALALAKIFWAREELRAATPKSVSTGLRVLAETEDLHMVDVQIARQHLERELNGGRATLQEQGSSPHIHR